MKTHVELLGLINIVSGALGILAGMVVSGVFLFLAPVTNDPVGTPLMFILALSIGGLLMVLGVPSMIAGIGLLKFKPWARILAIVLGVIALFNVPIGTLVGLYTFWVLTNDEAVKLLDATT